MSDSTPVIASNPERHAGRVVGNGHCVAFVREVTGLGPTSTWRAGDRVRGTALPRHTAIATFDRAGHYTSRTDGTAHAAVLIAEQGEGLLVWDQWVGSPVAQRVIRFRAGTSQPVNDGDAFHAIVGWAPPAKEA